MASRKVQNKIEKLEEELLKNEERFEALVKNRSRIHNDPITRIRKTAENMESKMFSPDDFRGIPFHEKY